MPVTSALRPSLRGCAIANCISASTSELVSRTKRVMLQRLAQKLIAFAQTFATTFLHGLIHKQILLPARLLTSKVGLPTSELRKQKVHWIKSTLGRMADIWST